MIKNFKALSKLAKSQPLGELFVLSAVERYAKEIISKQDEIRKSIDYVPIINEELWIDLAKKFDKGA